MTLSTKSGPPTISVLVPGFGFAADAEIEIEIDFDTAEVALLIANNSGAFSKIKSEIPASAATIIEKD